MTRYEKIKSMTIEEMAEKIVEVNITDEYCFGACVDDDEDINCTKENEIKCCVDWLNEEVEKNERYRKHNRIPKTL